MEIAISIFYFQFLFITAGLNRFVKWEYEINFGVIKEPVCTGFYITLWIVKFEFIYNFPYSVFKKRNK